MRIELMRRMSNLNGLSDLKEVARSRERERERKSERKEADKSKEDETFLF